jgi:hypothetical protein
VLERDDAHALHLAAAEHGCGLFLTNDVPVSGSSRFRVPNADTILAGCAATVGRPGDEVIIVSSNVRHLSRFPGIDAREWTSILP